MPNKMINAKIIQKLTRHSSLAVTQLYIETNDEQLLKVVNSQGGICCKYGYKVL